MIGLVYLTSCHDRMDFQVSQFLRRYPHGFRLMFNSMEEWIFKCLSSFVTIHTDSDLMVNSMEEWIFNCLNSLPWIINCPFPSFIPFFMFFHVSNNNNWKIFPSHLSIVKSFIVSILFSLALYSFFLYQLSYPRDRYSNEYKTITCLYVGLIFFSTL